MTRKIKIYNSVGNNNKEIQSAARTWGELQRELTGHGIPYSGMRVVIGETQNTLESTEALLPEGEITIFLIGQKVKSGSEDDYLIDWEDGITHTEVEWEKNESSVEEHDFKTAKDLTVARLKKAHFYLGKAVEFLVTDQKKTDSSPEVENMRRMAEAIQKNIQVFE